MLLIRSNKERTEQHRKTGSIPEHVKYYDIVSGTLDNMRPIGKAYGAPNLYQDVRNKKNVNELEKKLAALEGMAAGVIHRIHEEVDRSRNAPALVSIIRRDLDRLRKFLFIMHYRREYHAETYFSKDHPENQAISKRIERLQKRFGYETSGDLWLHFLRYYLDTPHNQIMEDAQPMANFSAMKNTLFNGADLDVEGYEACAYQAQAGMYFLSIWEAAPGTEFIISHNSFGLWEGNYGPSPQLHRLFVVSPRIAIVLKLNMAEIPMFSMFTQSSDFADVKITRPEVTYYDGRLGLDSNQENPTEKDILDYKKSDTAARDTFHFTVVRLSERHTHLMNAVILLNTNPNGAVSFLSSENMLATALAYRSRKDIFGFFLAKRSQYNDLISRLKSEISEPTSNSDSSATSQPTTAASITEIISDNSSQNSSSLSSTSGVQLSQVRSKPKLSKKDRFARAIALG
jgi:hypothetical protein